MAVEEKKRECLEYLLLSGSRIGPQISYLLSESDEELQVMKSISSSLIGSQMKNPFLQLISDICRAFHKNHRTVCQLPIFVFPSLLMDSIGHLNFINLHHPSLAKYSTTTSERNESDSTFIRPFRRDICQVMSRSSLDF
jgi:hypothetical protein